MRATTTSSYSRATRRSHRVELDAGGRLEELPVAASSASGMEPRNAGIAIPTTRPEAGHPPHHLGSHRGRVLVTEAAAADRPTFLENRASGASTEPHALAATMFIVPTHPDAPLEVGVVVDDDGTAIIHAMRLGPKLPRGCGRHDKPSKPNSGAQTTADSMSEDELREVDTSTLRDIAELAERRTVIDVELGEAVHRARLARRSRSKIGAMLDVSKQ